MQDKFYFGTKHMKTNKFTTKIIAGKYKGKNLEIPPLNITRSSKSRLKESLFNVLQFNIIDKIFIEAFAGSGSIGLEAISRGAKLSYFIEIDKNSYNILLKNCKAIDIDKCQLINGNSFMQTPKVIESLKNSKEQLIIYIDPPFDYRDGMENIYDKSFEIVKNIENKNIYLIIFEHSSTLKMPDNLGVFFLDRTKKFGKSSLSYYKTNWNKND